MARDAVHGFENVLPDGMSLRIVGYQEEGEWVALALEMDLRGYGATFEDALDELRELVVMQIGFALFKGAPEMALKEAEPVWFALWDRIQRAKLEAALAHRRFTRADAQIAELPLPEPHVIDRLRRDGFQPAGA